MLLFLEMLLQLYPGQPYIQSRMFEIDILHVSKHLNYEVSCPCFMIDLYVGDEGHQNSVYAQNKVRETNSDTALPRLFLGVVELVELYPRNKLTHDTT